MRVCTKCGRTSDMRVAVCPACHGALVTAVDTQTDGSAALEIDPSEELAPGTRVGDYEIEKRIGYGGMGIVYGAIHPLIGKRVAIKVLNAKYCADHESVARFVREAQAVNKIGHANIVDIFAIGMLPDGRSYLVMEWLQGETLMDRLERGEIPRTQTIELLVALTRALEAAHNAGVIHRDLKPENVYLIPEDETVRVKLLDFGIAKLETRRAPTRKTATGMTVGTPLYMSPEQAKGIAIDGRTDIYSLGILAYSMLCRTTPFESEESPVEVLHAHISKPPQPPRERVKDIPLALDTLILDMLAKNPDERPPLPEIRRRLKQLDGGSFETFTAETPLPARPQPPMAGTIDIDVVPPRRSRVPFLLVMLVLIGGGAGAYWYYEQHQPGDPPTVAEPAPKPVVTPRVEPQEPERPPPAPLGKLEISVEPASAMVTLDGKPLALEAGKLTVELPAGDHKLAATANGYRAAEQTFAVTLETVTAAPLKLAKVKAATRPPKKSPKDVDAVVNPFKKKGK